MTDERTKSSGVTIARAILSDQHLSEWSYRALARLGGEHWRRWPTRSETLSSKAGRSNVCQ
jgi:hypothetical protein